MSLLHRLTGSVSANLCNNALSFIYVFDIITGIIHLITPQKMNMIVNNFHFHFYKNIIVGINNNTCNNNDNNKVKDKYNCYDYKFKKIKKFKTIALIIVK